MTSSTSNHVQAPRPAIATSRIAMSSRLEVVTQTIYRTPCNVALLSSMGSTYNWSSHDRLCSGSSLVDIQFALYIISNAVMVIGHYKSKALVQVWSLYRFCSCASTRECFSPPGFQIVIFRSNTSLIRYIIPVLMHRILPYGCRQCLATRSRRPRLQSHPVHQHLYPG